MLRRLLLAAALAAGFSSPALAQAARVVQDCTGYSARVNDASSLTVDQTGKLCTAGSGGGGGGGSSVVAGTQEQDITESRTLNAATVGAQQTYTLNGQATASFNIAGLTASGATISFFQSNDWNGTTGTFTAVSEVNTGTGIASLSRTTDGQSAIGIEGSKAVRFQVTTAGTGTITLATNISVRSRYTALRSPVLVGNDGTTQRQILTTTTGALEPSTAAAGKITRTSTALTANTSTTIAAANANRVALGLQCGSGGVSVDETGGALTAAGVGNGTLFLPSGTGPYFTPPVATRAALTAYTATAQTCVVTEYLR